MDLLTTFAGLHTATTALFDSLRPEVKEQEEMLRRFVTETQEDLTLIRAHHQALAAELETSRTLVGEVHTSLASLTACLRSWQ